MWVSIPLFWEWHRIYFTLPEQAQHGDQLHHCLFLLHQKNLSVMRNELEQDVVLLALQKGTHQGEVLKFITEKIY